MPADTHILSLFDLGGRTALVTGASRGLGRGIAVALAQAGANVIVTSRNVTRLSETVAEIEAAGRTATAIACDHADPGSIATALSDLPAVDILINNAGIEDVRPSRGVDEALWDRIVDTNLKGAFFTARHVGAGMLDRGRGSILNLASLTSYLGVPTATPYGASKSGVLGMTRALATEWGPQGVRVNAIAPGYFRTAMTYGFFESPNWAETMLARIPLGRFGTEADLAGAAIFLVSDAAGYVNGQCLGIDGGFLASI